MLIFLCWENRECKAGRRRAVARGMPAFTVAVLMALAAWRSFLILFLAAFFATGFCRSFFMMASIPLPAGKSNTGAH